jgi:hypothetical protein
MSSGFCTQQAASVVFEAAHKHRAFANAKKTFQKGKDAFDPFVGLYYAAKSCTVAIKEAKQNILENTRFGLLFNEDLYLESFDQRTLRFPKDKISLRRMVGLDMRPTSKELIDLWVTTAKECYEGNILFPNGLSSYWDRYEESQQRPVNYLKDLRQ